MSETKRVWVAMALIRSNGMGGAGTGFLGFYNSVAGYNGEDKALCEASVARLNNGILKHAPEIEDMSLDMPSQTSSKAYVVECWSTRSGYFAIDDKRFKHGV